VARSGLITLLASAACAQVVYPPFIERWHYAALFTACLHMSETTDAERVRVNVGRALDLFRLIGRTLTRAHALAQLMLLRMEAAHQVYTDAHLSPSSPRSPVPVINLLLGYVDRQRLSSGVFFRGQHTAVRLRARPNPVGLDEAIFSSETPSAFSHAEVRAHVCSDRAARLSGAGSVYKYCIESHMLVDLVLSADDGAMCGVHVVM